MVMGVDMLAVLSLIVAISEPPENKIGNWQAWTRVDPITDQKRAGIGIVTEDGTLTVKCDQAGFDSVYVSFSGGQFFGSGRSTTTRRPVIFRVGDGPPQETLWLYSDNDHVLLTRDVNRLTGPLLEADKLAIRAYTYRFQEVTRTFDTTGANEAIPWVYENCNDRM